MASSTGAVSTRMALASTMSDSRLTSRLVPVKGVSHRPTTGTPFMSCRRPWMMLMPNTSGTKKHTGRGALHLLQQSTMRGCEPSGSVM
jgi:hypothetical protein